MPRKGIVMAQEHVDRRTEAARARAARKAKLADESRQIRAAAGWTQVDAAREIGASRDAITRIENGRMEYSAAAECVGALRLAAVGRPPASASPRSRAMGPATEKTETRKEQEQ